MNADHRHPDAAIATWLADGPGPATRETRQAIATSIRGIPQRSRARSLEAWRQRWLLAAAAVLVAIVAIAVAAGGLRLIQAVETAPPSGAFETEGPSISATMVPTAEPGRNTLTLSRPERAITLSIARPDGFGLRSTDVRAEVALVSFTDGVSGPEASFEPGAHGITIADVAGSAEHGSVERHPVFGSTAAEFMAGLDSSPYFAVEDLAPTTLAGRDALSGRVTLEAQYWSHLDVRTASGNHASVELGMPNVILVADFDDAIMLVEIWADTDETLEDWLPRALDLVETIRFDSVQPTSTPR